MVRTLQGPTVRTAGFVFIALLAALATVRGASANHSDGGTLRLLSIHEDQFHNWDFQNGGARVDWPITILYWGNAEVDKIKDAYRAVGWSGGTCGDSMWGHYNDGYGLDWDTDDGIKVPCIPGCFVSGYHVRLYAPPGTDRMYNPSWGYYVFASSHRDRSELCVGAERQYGWSEDAEGYAVDVARNRFGWSGSHDWSSFLNGVPTGWVSNHYVQNNGLASQVRVP